MRTYLLPTLRHQIGRCWLGLALLSLPRGSRRPQCLPIHHPQLRTSLDPLQIQEGFAFIYSSLFVLIYPSWSSDLDMLHACLAVGSVEKVLDWVTWDFDTALISNSWNLRLWKSHLQVTMALEMLILSFKVDTMALHLALKASDSDASLIRNASKIRRSSMLCGGAK